MKWCLALVGMLALFAPGTVHAQTPSPEAPRGPGLRAVVWLGALDAALLERIRGQTSDLEVELVVEAAVPIPTDQASQLRTARQLSLREDARVVLWLTRRDDGTGPWVLTVALPGEERLLERELEPSPAAAPAPADGARSATLEAAALVVRESAQALALGETIGAPATGRFADLPPASEPPPPSPPPPPPEPSPAAEPALPAPLPALGPTAPPPRARARSEGELSVASSLTLREPVGGGLLARGAWRTRHAELSLLAGVTLPVEITSEYGAFSLTRTTLLAGSSAVLARREVLLRLGLRAGLAAYQRRTTYAPPGIAAYPSQWTPALALGPEVRVGAPGGPARVRAELGLALDFVAGGPAIGYFVGEEFVTVQPAPRVEPQLWLGLALPILRVDHFRTLP